MVEVDGGTIAIVGMGCVIIVLCFIFSAYQMDTDLTECIEYESYGYVTEFRGDIWHWDCLVYMNDGTKLPLNDFKTMVYKEPLVRGKCGTIKAVEEIPKGWIIERKLDGYRTLWINGEFMNRRGNRVSDNRQNYCNECKGRRGNKR